MDDFIDAVKFFFVFGFFVILIFAIFIIGGFALSSAQCKGFEEGTGIETKWKFGCYANVNGNWLPAEYVFGDVNELRIKGEQK